MGIGGDAVMIISLASERLREKGRTRKGNWTETERQVDGFAAVWSGSDDYRVKVSSSLSFLSLSPVARYIAHSQATLTERERVQTVH